MDGFGFGFGFEVGGSIQETPNPQDLNQFGTSSAGSLWILSFISTVELQFVAVFFISLDAFTGLYCELSMSLVPTVVIGDNAFLYLIHLHMRLMELPNKVNVLCNPLNRLWDNNGSFILVSMWSFWHVIYRPSWDLSLTVIKILGFDAHGQSRFTGTTFWFSN